jgi:predicted MFS family arabinose efflux permease
MTDSPRTRDQDRWRPLIIAVVLLTAMFVGTFPQFAIGVLAPVLRTELRIGELELGIVASLLYAVAALVARYTGNAIDRIRGRRALGLLFVTSTVSLVALSMSGSLGGLVIAVLLCGLAVGANNPVTNRIIAVHIPHGRRALVLAVKQTGVKLAHLASGALVPLFVLTIGWRAGLRWMAVVTVVIAVGGLLVLPDGNGSDQNDGSQPAGTEQVRLAVRWLRYYAGLMGIGTAAITTYLALYAVEHVGMSLTEAGLVVTTLGAFAVAARLLWGTVAERTGRPASVLVFLSAVGALSLTGLSFAVATGPWLLWCSAIVAGATMGSWNVVAHLTVVNEIATSRAASATGLVQAAFLIGLAVGAPVFGLIVERGGGFRTAWLMTAALSLGALVIAGHEVARRRTEAETRLISTPTPLGRDG